MIPIDSLYITQDELRKPHQIEDMVEFVLNDGNFDIESLSSWEKTVPRPDMLIEIAEFPDGKYYIHNGHHRVVSIILAGGSHLFEWEYYIKKWNYSDYNDIVFLNPDGTWRGYVTPFNISIECRLPDFSKYKERVKAIYAQHGHKAAVEYILSHPHEYKRDKSIFTAKELSLKYDYPNKELIYATSHLSTS